ncbi:MAG: lytic murein transglycosylase [Magnetococcales bacterium]|nr:lytic murein transglycosylase [Magnetococcales bacterium]
MNPSIPSPSDHCDFPNRRRLLRWMGALPLFLWLTGPLANANTNRDLVAQYPWLQAWVEQDGLDREWLNALLSPLKVDQRVIDLMNSQAEAKPYYLYRPIFINDQRIRRGRRQMRNHAPLFANVEQHYQVPARFVAALWGMESDFGDYHDGFNILRSLFTLATAYPRRASFFQSQLRHLLLLAREEGWNPATLKGSFAGAMGQCQMIPETMRRYLVDFDGDGHRDPFRSVPDVVGSIANFLQQNGWRRDGLYSLPLADDGGMESLSKQWQKQWRTIDDWRRNDLPFPPSTPQLDPNESASLIRLVHASGPGFYLVFNNFKVITNWNRSSHFAMAVGELAARIQPG